MGNSPQPCNLDLVKYASIIERIYSTGSDKNAAEHYFSIIARDILEGKGEFNSVVEIPNRNRQPFDLLAKRGGESVIIELKGKKDGYGFPDQTQLARMQALLILFERMGIKMHPYLLQINLGKKEYQLWGPDGVRSLFDGIDPRLGCPPRV